MRSRRRVGQYAAAMVLIGSGVAGTTSTVAQAATTLDVQVGYGGSFYPGRPVRVRITVTADRLVRGTLEVRMAQGPAQVVLSRPVEVPGGSDKQFVVAMPDAGVFFGGPGANASAEVSLRQDGDEIASGRGSAQWTVDGELVGVLPGAGAAGSFPESVGLAIDAGAARLSPIDQLDLDEPGALGALDMLAVDQNELGSLGPDARQAVLDWVSDGGRLLVVAPTGTEVAGLPAAWQPGAGGRAQAEQGDVVALGGERSSWFRALLPTPTRSAMEDGGQMLRGFGGVPASTIIAQDAGLRLARLGWLIAFLIAYVVVVGPIAHIVLRRSNRALWFWFVVPALAALFTGGAWLVGRSLRSGATAAQTTIVELRPEGARATTWVGVVSRGGGTVDIALPRGWVGRLSSSAVMTGETRPMRVNITGKGAVSRLELNAGEFGLVSAAGPVAVDGTLEIDASSTEDGRVEGTVRNTTTLALDGVRAFAGGASVVVGSLAPGEGKPFVVTGASTLNFGGAPTDAWGQFSAFTNGLDASVPANAGAWAELQQQHGIAWADGSSVAVAGWTKEFPAPVRPDGRALKGRTALSATARVRPGDAHLTDRAIPRSVLRTNATSGPNATGRWSATYQFDLPDGTGSATPLWLRAPGGNLDVSVWDGDRWRPITLAGGAVVPAAPLPQANVPAGPGGGAIAVATTFAPFPGSGQVASSDAQVGPVPPSAVRDERIFVQVTAPVDNGPGPAVLDVYLTGTPPR